MALSRVIRRHGWRVIALLGTIALVVPSTVYADPNDPKQGLGDWLTPYAPVAKQIANLYDIVYYIAIAVFVIVEGLILYASFRYRFRKDAERKPIPQVHGNTSLEVTWTAIPALIVAGLFFLTFNVMTNIQNGPENGTISLQPNHIAHGAAVSLAGAAPAGALQVEAIGHQWWWEFRYPDLGITTASIMHVPKDRAVVVVTSSEDVIHSWWAPQMQGKLDAVPGVKNQTWFKPDAVGLYHAQCAEFCGAEHAIMQFRVQVDSTQDFDTWAAEQVKPAPEISADQAQIKKGEGLFKDRACIGCHAIAGYPGDIAKGKVGPNLTHFYSRQIFAGGAGERDKPGDIEAWLRNPEAVKPGNKMATVVKPGFLTEDDIANLTAYLKSLK